MELMNVRFTFYCRSTHKNEEGKSPIVLRIVYRNERKDVFTGLYCFLNDWDATGQIVDKTEKTARRVNDNLKLILHRASDAFDLLRHSRSVFTIHDLADKIKGNDAKPTLLTDYLELQIEKLDKRRAVDITKSSFQKYKRGIALVQDFLESKYKTNIALQRIDGKFIENYFYFL